MRVLTWNLFHGRGQPTQGRELREDFARALAGWSWDVALLQEVPPWWPPLLAEACGASARAVLTSRHEGLALRRALARRWPDLLRSHGGGANALLVRGAIVEHRERLLRRWPERRRAHAVRLAGGCWVVNLHGAAHRPARARRDLELAAAWALDFAQGAPLVLGGDLNLRHVALDGLNHVAGHSVDHLLARGLRAASAPRTLPHRPLSDHAPLVVDLEPARLVPAA